MRMAGIGREKLRDALCLRVSIISSHKATESTKAFGGVRRAAGIGREKLRDALCLCVSIIASHKATEHHGGAFGVGEAGGAPENPLMLCVSV